ncbi:hypothetical protein GCM10009594_18670 [Kocuria palustris]
MAGIVAGRVIAVVRELPGDGPRLAIVPQTIADEDHWSQITAALHCPIVETAQIG